MCSCKFPHIHFCQKLAKPHNSWQILKKVIFLWSHGVVLWLCKINLCTLHTALSLVPQFCHAINESNSRSLSWSSNVYLIMHWRIWQMTVSSSLMSARANSARLTQRCVLFDVHTTPSAIGVSQRLDLACGTRCPPNDDDTLGQFKWLLKTHLNTGTTALCGIFFS